MAVSDAAKRWFLEPFDSYHIKYHTPIITSCWLDADDIWGRSSWVMWAITVSAVIACMHLKHSSCHMSRWPTPTHRVTRDKHYTVDQLK